jgi:hypothetical protein
MDGESGAPFRLFFEQCQHREQKTDEDQDGLGVVHFISLPHEVEFFGLTYIKAIIVPHNKINYLHGLARRNGKTYAVFV